MDEPIRHFNDQFPIYSDRGAVCIKSLSEEKEYTTTLINAQNVPIKFFLREPQCLLCESLCNKKLLHREPRRNHRASQRKFNI